MVLETIITVACLIWALGLWKTYQTDKHRDAVDAAALNRYFRTQRALRRARKRQRRQEE